ncbi:MAG: hypothetical protein KAW03_00515, partial [Candidatus Lokiarchaeota archaeon]|nr:hypothetical protein [Candidatus Lokiarchaeota archaeon]
MTEIKLFVDANNDIKDKILICQSNANKLGVKDGDSIEVLNIENNLKKTAKVEISDTILDFAGQFAKNILDDLQFSGVELSVRPSSGAAKLTPTLRVPKVPTPQPTPPSEPIPESTPGPTLSPLPTPPAPQPTPTPTPALQPTYTPTPPPQPSLTPPPTPIPQPTPAPTPTQPLLSPLPSKPPPPMEIPQPSYGQPIIEPTAPVEPFPNKIDINMLQSQINGIILTPKLDNNIEGGRVQLSVGILQQLGLGQGMLIAWEDPLTRAMGSARIDQANIGMNEIKMSMDTYE